MNYIDTSMLQASDRERELYFNQCMSYSDQSKLNLTATAGYILFLIKQIETQEKLIKKQEEQIRFLSKYIENGGMKFDNDC